MTARGSDRWARTTFGRLARIRNGADYRSVEVEAGGYPVYGSGGEFRRASSFLFDGESVLFGRKGTVDRPLYVSGKFWTVDTMFYSVIDKSRLIPRFAYYWATTLPFGEWATDTALPSMTSTALKAAPINLPSVPEQRAIADYLDRETAQIDAFIAKNEELITLLTERRASVIRQATTVGFEKRGELIESKLHGVGPIPRDWRVMRLSWLFHKTASGTTPSSDLLLDGEEADVWWVTTGELRERTITSTRKGISAETVKAASALKLHPSGSLLVAMYGATIGRTGVLGVPAASNQAVCALSGPVGCDVEFVEYAMIAARERLLLAAVGGGQPNINQEVIRAFRIPVPSLAEQQSIVQELRERLGELDRAISVAGKGIKLACERRTALISAAVTGKITVGVAA